VLEEKRTTPPRTTRVRRAPIRNKSPVSLVAPTLAAFNDQIVQNKELFARIAAVYDAREAGGLTPEQKRLVWLDYTRPPSAPWS